MISVGDILFDRYSITSFLHQTFFGYGFTAIDNETRKPVLLDLVDPFLFKLTLPELTGFTRSDLEKISKVDHPALFVQEGFFDHQGHLGIVYQYHQEINLADLITYYKLSGQTFSNQEIYALLKTTLGALERVNTLHPYLKLSPPSLWVGNGQLKLGQVYLSERFTQSFALRSELFAEHSGYLPPELIDFNKHYANSDFYSLGAVYYQLVTGNTPDQSVLGCNSPCVQGPIDHAFLVGKLTTYFPDNRCATFKEVSNGLNRVFEPLFANEPDLSPAKILQELWQRVRNIEFSPKSEHVEITNRVSRHRIQGSPEVGSEEKTNLGFTLLQDQNASEQMEDMVAQDMKKEREFKGEEDTKRTTKQQLKEHFKIIRKAMSGGTSTFSARAFFIVFTSLFGVSLAFGFFAFKQFGEKEAISQETINSLLVDESMTLEREAHQMSLKAITVYQDKLDELEKNLPSGEEKGAGKNEASKTGSAAEIKASGQVPVQAILSGGACPDSMTLLKKEAGSFCIDTLEFPNIPGEYPGVNVSFDEAKNFCSQAGKRLCSLSEWQFSCQGLGKRGSCCGEAKTGKGKGCNVQRPKSEERIGKLGEFSLCQTPEGVGDLNGNVAEWVSLAPDEGAAVVGGSYLDTLAQSTCQKVEHSLPSTKSPAIGFRCCL
jgi:serine/threonine protein kinase